MSAITAERTVARRLGRFTGTRNLLRFAVRRDRLRAPLWFVGVVGVFTATAGSVVALYKTPDQLASYATLAVDNPAVQALTGPGYGLDDPTQGSVVLNEMGMFTFIAIALLALVTVIRHTRAEEETDRAELVRAAPVGRHASLAAASLWTAALTTVVSLGLTVSMLTSGLDPAGSWAFGLACAGVGFVFIGVANVAAQIASEARAAIAASGAVLAVMFVVRALGDVSGNWLVWLSPLGWAQGIRAYADERWWVLVPLLVTGGALTIVALVLSRRRDLGAGILQQRPGPAEASPRLRSPLMLALRLQRTSIIGWAAGLGIVWVFMGVVAKQADTLLENQAVADVIGGSGAASPSDSFLATIVLMAGLVAAGFTISAVLRLRSEEVAGRAEPTLANAVSRRTWALSHLAVSSAGTVLVLVSAGLTAGIGYAIGVGDAAEVLPLVGAVLAMSVAVLVLGAFAFALFGLAPRWASLAWVGVALGGVVALLGATLDLPQWIRNFSPFEHVPALPAEPFNAVPLLVLAAVAGVLVWIGVRGFGRRDIN